MDIYLGNALSTVTLDAIIAWLIPALVSFFVGYSFYRKGRMRLRTCLALALLIFYIAFTLNLTIIQREVTAYARYKVVLFWSYTSIAKGDITKVFEVLWNVVLFVPIGLLGSILLKQKAKWIVMLSGLAFSTAIELTQLITHRGYFEFDDLVHNTLGTVIGIVICLVCAKILIKAENKYNLQLI